MKRFVVGACAVAFCALPSTSPTPSAASDLRALPMQFELRQEGPSEACKPNCRTWVSATGAITADTPRDFEAFAKTRNIRGTTLVLDFGRRLGAGRAGARPHGAQARYDDCGRQDRRIAASERREARANRAECLLRVDVRLRAAGRRRAPRAGGGARPGPSDLARRPPRRPDRRPLLGRGPCAGAARYRPARAIHRGDGRGDRPARNRAEDFRLGSRCGCCPARNCAA